MRICGPSLVPLPLRTWAVRPNAVSLHMPAFAASDEAQSKCASERGYRAQHIASKRRVRFENNMQLQAAHLSCVLQGYLGIKAAHRDGLIDCVVRRAEAM